MSARRRTALGVLAALLALAPASGCVRGFLQRSQPEKQRFMLRVAEPAASSAEPVAGVVRVERVRVSPLFDNKGFVYRTGEDTFDSDFYNEFFAPPGVLLREALVRWLEAAHLFAGIDRGSSSEPQWVLETDVEQILADRRTPAQPRGFVALAFRVVDAASRKPAFEKRYTASEPARDRKPAALVEAWNRALGTVLGEFARDLRAALARPRAGSR